MLALRAAVRLTADGAFLFARYRAVCCGHFGWLCLVTGGKTVGVRRYDGVTVEMFLETGIENPIISMDTNTPIRSSLRPIQ